MISVTSLADIVPQNDQQSQLLKTGFAFIQKGQTPELGAGNAPSNALRIVGYAGSGKTYLFFALMRYALGLNYRVAFTAPTHKALNVGRQMARSLAIADRVDFFTIQSFLGLTLEKRQGEKMLRRSKPSYAPFYDVLGLDEGSMLNQDAWRYVGEELERSSIKFMGMGDPAQLYPPGENISPFFKTDMPQVKLSEVVRQAEGPLMDLVTAARKAVTRKRDRYRAFRPQGLSRGEMAVGAMASSRKQLIQTACSALERFEEDPNCFRILAYRNKTVDGYNRRIRREHYGPDAPQYQIGERLISRDTVMAPDRKTILMQTSTEFVVTDVLETHYGGYQAWRLTVQPETGQPPIQIYALHEDDRRRFEAESKRLLGVAQRNYRCWRQYYDHGETFAAIRPCYALTVHSSQGSTYDWGGVDGADIANRLYPREGESKLRAMREHNRLWYVGLSRSRTKVLVAQ